MNDKVDVVILTKDSEEVLEKCIDSIYANLPVSTLIFVDGFSTDKTVDIIERYRDMHGNVEIFQDNGTRATARQIGIKNVRTKYFVFVDSDVVLCRDWFEKASAYIDDSTGIVWGLNIDVVPGLESRLFLKMWKHAAKEAFNNRGGMHDTLIRYDSVKDIRIPENLHFYEDTYITRHVAKKGFKIVAPDDLYCLHFRPQSDWSFRESVRIAYADIRYGLLHFHMFRYSLYYPFFVVYWILQNVKKISGNKYSF